MGGRAVVRAAPCSSRLYDSRGCRPPPSPTLILLVDLVFDPAASPSRRSDWHSPDLPSPAQSTSPLCLGRSPARQAHTADAFPSLALPWLPLRAPTATAIRPCRSSTSRLTGSSRTGPTTSTLSSVRPPPSSPRPRPRLRAALTPNPSRAPSLAGTGDNARHDISRALPRSPAEIYDLNRKMVGRMHDVFGKRGVRVVPSLGNNDIWRGSLSFPSACLLVDAIALVGGGDDCDGAEPFSLKLIPLTPAPLHPLPLLPLPGRTPGPPAHNIMYPGPNDITETFLDIWSAHIPSEQTHVFERGPSLRPFCPAVFPPLALAYRMTDPSTPSYFLRAGAYFTADVVPDRLAVVSLNTLFWYDSNKAVDGCPFDGSEPGSEQMEWLEVQLGIFRARGMQVRLFPAATSSRAATHADGASRRSPRLANRSGSRATSRPRRATTFPTAGSGSVSSCSRSRTRSSAPSLAT